MNKSQNNYIKFKKQNKEWGHAEWSYLYKTLENVN